MAIKPMLFNTEMVRAILSGQKTCTRRVVKSGSYTPMEMACPKFYGFRDELNGKPGAWAGFYGDRHVFIGQDGKQHIDAIYAKLPCHPGDVLYVRETWNGIRTGNPKMGYRTTYWYKADDKYDNPDDKWRPSIHMPKEAARIFLRVTDVRVERLQKISGDGCAMEGITLFSGLNREREPYYRNAFSVLWDCTIKPADRDRYGWAANPWVWVIVFERISKEAALGGDT